MTNVLCPVCRELVKLTVNDKIYKHLRKVSRNRKLPCTGSGLAPGQKPEPTVLPWNSVK